MCAWQGSAKVEWGPLGRLCGQAMQATHCLTHPHYCVPTPPGSLFLLHHHTSPARPSCPLPPRRCSGEDGINVADQADPLFRRCVVTGKKCGVRTYGSARGRFEDCTFEKCGEQGFKAMETSAPTLAG